jgi:hypothetical protein
VADYVGWDDPGVGKHCLIMFFSGVFYLLVLVLVEWGIVSRLIRSFRREGPVVVTQAQSGESCVCVLVIKSFQLTRGSLCV